MDSSHINLSKIVVIEVSRIGLSLVVLLASITASILSPPSALLHMLIKSIRTMESFTTIPVRAIIHKNDIMPMGVLVMINPITIVTTIDKKGKDKEMQGEIKTGMLWDDKARQSLKQVPSEIKKGSSNETSI